MLYRGTKYNRDVWNGGAQLHKSQNIGWARACVPTVHIWPCKYTAKMHLWARSKVGFTQPLLWDSSKDMSRTKVRPICPFLFSKGSHCAPICFVFCKLCFDFWRKTAKSGCLCKGTLQKLPNFLFEKNHKVTKNKKQIGDVWKNGRKCYSYIQLNTWYENWCQSLRFVTQIAVLSGWLRAPFLIHECISNFDTSLQGWTEGNFWRPKQKEKQKEKKLLPLAKGRSRRFSNLKF